jgi:porphobilinogen deaminase
MARIEAGCHTPMAAYGVVEDNGAVRLRAHLFSDDGTRLAEGEERGEDPIVVGQSLGASLLAELGEG